MAAKCTMRVTRIVIEPYSGGPASVSSEAAPPRVITRRVELVTVDKDMPDYWSLPQPEEGKPTGQATYLILDEEAGKEFVVDEEYEVVFTRVKTG